MSQSTLSRPPGPPGSVPLRAAPIEARLMAAQAVAGALFFVFLVMHLANTVLAVFGAEVYNEVQRALQRIYQQPIVELVLVILPLLTHAVAGAWLYVIRRKRRFRPPLRYRLHGWAGGFLLLVVFGHVLATRGIGYYFDAPPGFSGVAFSLWWVPGYFYPYYFLLFMAGLYHGLTGLGRISRQAGVSTARSEVSAPTLAIGAAAVLFALLSFGGELGEIDDPRASAYAQQYSTLLGVDLSGAWKGEADDAQ